MSRFDQPIQASVTVQLIGEPAGVKEGGVLSQVQREVGVEALPMEIPEHIDLDVSGMAIGDTLRLADLAPIEGVTYLDDPEETVLASVRSSATTARASRRLTCGPGLAHLTPVEMATSQSIICPLLTPPPYVLGRAGAACWPVVP